MTVAVKNVVKPPRIFEKRRKSLHGAVLTKARDIAKHGLWRSLEESVQRDDTIPAAFTILDDMKFNDCLMDHAK